jgi:rRNA maturation RNase YbeY
MGKELPDIQIFNQTSHHIPFEQSFCQGIANQLADKEECSFNFVEVVFVDEDKIVEINKKHLNRDYVTDIITFRYDDSQDCQMVEGTMFCCAQRIIEQAREFNEFTEREFQRIFIHGLLHLVGYDDLSAEEKKQMTEKEDFYLAEAKTLQ